MIYLMCSVYDEKAGIYAPPFATVNAATAIRMFEQLANDPQTQVGRHPSDFHLYEVGHYDDQLGQLTPGVPRNLGRADQLVRQQGGLFFDPAEVEARAAAARDANGRM